MAPRIDRRRLIKAAVASSLLAALPFAMAGCQASPSARSSSSVQPAGLLDVHSWQELADLSQRLRSVQTSEERRSIAIGAALLGEDGSFELGRYKTIDLSNGRSCRAVLAGICHDSLPNGSLAGLTFLFLDSIEERGMNEAATSLGGWASSDVRGYLADEGMSLLPPELAPLIVGVSKSTICERESENAVVTEDTLWLCSDSELNADNSSVPEEATPSDGRLFLEGAPYQLFLDSSRGCAFNEPYIRRNTAGGWSMWWERTLDPSIDSFAYRSYAGSPFRNSPRTISYSANFHMGIAPGFCI